MLCDGVDGVGPSETCYRICREWPALGRPTAIFATRQRIKETSGLIQAAVPHGFAFMSERLTRGWSVAKSARACVAALSSDDLVYVWPAAPNEYVAAAKDRGAKILVENINTFTGYAREIIDAASESIGAAPQHVIDDTLVAAELERLSLADYVFAPNKFVEESLKGTGLDNFVTIPTSYGTYIPVEAPGVRTNPRLQFLYVGRVCVRKGAHRLIEAWVEAGIDGDLVFCGEADEFIRRRYAAQLADSSIQLTGFCGDIGTYYAASDVFVFPSLEEGGPQVCYEAAAYGLPQITTSMGGGRIAKHGRNALIVAPDDSGALVDALRTLARSTELRHELGSNARIDAEAFSWRNVARQRHLALQALEAR